mmetsp:Transcript_6548/g.22569  ORF Transcript_6548/g.22569 Transcript_6548/m.22569 type:complete len:476 (+) Transcript_6548:267-1694(+)
MDPEAAEREEAPREKKDKVHSRGEASDDTGERPAKVARTDGGDEAEDLGDVKGSGSPNGDEDEDGRSRSRSPAEENVAAPTRRSLRSRRPTTVAKSVAAASDKTDKAETKKAAGGSQAKQDASRGKDDTDADAEAERAAKAAKERDLRARREREEKESLRYSGFPFDLSSLTRQTKPVKLDQDSCVRVLVGREFLSSNNRQVRSRQLWGTGFYTEDSDVVAALVHCGYVNLALIDSVAAEIDSLSVRLEVSREPRQFVSTNSNNIRSRSWRAHEPEEGRCSFSIRSCSATLVSGEELDLHASPEAFAIIPPTFVPAATERVVNTRSSATSSDRKNRMRQQVTLQYNLCNEPWLKYVVGSVADQGLQAAKRTSARMRQEVIYAESQTQRYELNLTTSQPNSDVDLYQFARCKEVRPVSEMRKLGIPCPGAEVEVLEQAFEWEDVKWADKGVHVNGTFYPLCRIHFMQRQDPAGTSS